MAMDKEQRLLQLEAEELNKLIREGVAFTIDTTAFECRRTWYGRKVYTEHRVEREFVLHEPTLSTMDRLSAEWVQLAIDENMMKDGLDAMSYALQMVNRHTERCARIVAIAVLDEERFVLQPSPNGTTRYVEDTGKINELTSLLLHSVRPSKLRQLFMAVINILNLGDFMNSIRLMSSSRTTMPVRIEVVV